MTRLGDDVVGSFLHGANGDVDTTAEALVSSSKRATRGVQLKAAAENTGTIYVGMDSGVTAGSVDATDGFPLAAGEGLFLPIDDASKVYVIGSANNQRVYWLAI
jgi:hypothetical protein